MSHIQANCFVLNLNIAIGLPLALNTLNSKEITLTHNFFIFFDM